MNHSTTPNLPNSYTAGCSIAIALLPLHIKAVFTTFFIIVGLVGTLLNALLFFLFARWRFMRRGGNKLFFSMCVADILVTSFFIITKILPMYNTRHCAINSLGRVSGCLLLISATSVAVISFTYYRRLKQFRKYHFLSRDDEPPYMLVIAVCWCTPIALTILASFISNLLYLIVSIIFFLVFYVLFVVCYNLVVQQLMEQYKEAKRLDLAKVDEMVISTKFKKTSELIGLVMLSAFVLSLPLLLFLLSAFMLEVSGQNHRQPHTNTLAAIGHLTYACHALMTPIICLWKHSDVRRAYRKTLKAFRIDRRGRNKVIPYMAD